MNTGPTITSNRQLRLCWSRFSDIVRAFADKKMQRNQVAHEQYQSIHSELLKSLQEAMESTPEKRELYTRMSELASPWMHIDAFDQADSRILKDLATRCEEFEHELTNRRPRISRGAVLAMLFVLFLATFALILGSDAWGGLYDRIFDGQGGKMAEWLQALERNRNQSRTWLIAGVAAVATAATAWFVFRAPKNY